MPLPIEMTPALATGLVVAALLIAIVLGTAKKINVGIIAMAFAWIIGCWLGGKFASQVTTLFPIKVVMYLIAINFFYGFAIVNGTMKQLGDRMMYAFRGKVKLIPFAIPLAAMVIAGCGGGGLMGDIVMIPIAILLAERIGMHPLLALYAVAAFAPVGGTTFWSVGGVASLGVASQTFDPAFALSMVQAHSFAYFGAVLGFYIILYIVFKGWKVNTEGVEIAKPEPMNRNQKITLGLIITLIILVVVPALINIIAPNPVCRYLANFIFEIQVLCLIFGVICSLLGVADPAEIIKTQIPWNLILTIGGVATLVAVAQTYGVVDLIGGMIGDSVGARGAVTLMTMIGGILSMVTDGLGVGLPTFYPMLPTIAAGSGAPVAAMFIGFTMGTWATGISPLSSAGGLSLGLMGEKYRNKLFVPQLILAIAICAWLTLLAALGYFNLFAGMVPAV